MCKALASLVCLLAIIGVLAAEEPARNYHVELVIHQGPKKADRSSIVSCPSLYLTQDQPGQVSVGQDVRLWGDKPRIVGLRAEAKVRPGTKGLTLWMRIEHSEVVHDADGKPQISTVGTEFEKDVRPDVPFVARPARVGEKTLWAEVRVKPATR